MEKLTKDELKVVVGILAKEHDTLYEIIMQHDADEQATRKDELAVRKFLLLAWEKYGLDVNGLYTLDEKIRRIG